MKREVYLISDTLECRGFLAQLGVHECMRSTLCPSCHDVIVAWLYLNAYAQVVDHVTTPSTYRWTQFATDQPTNDNPELHDQALLCVTDLEDCCDAILTDEVSLLVQISEIEVQNSEVLNGRQFYGSVHLHRLSNPLERGHFHYQLPNATDPNIAQTLYVNIGGYKSTVYLHDQ